MARQVAQNIVQCNTFVLLMLQDRGRSFLPCTGGSVGRALGCHGGGREFDSSRTNTQGLKIIEEKVLPLYM